MTTEAAVGEAVQRAFEQCGGTGDCEPVILRGGIKQMRIYLAGMITNLDPLTAAECFRRAAVHVEGCGHVPLNPLTLVCQKEGRCYEEYLLDALRIMLLDADAIYLLPNWRRSRGAKIEHFIAKTLGKPVYDENTGLPVED